MEKKERKFKRAKEIINENKTALISLISRKAGWQVYLDSMNAGFSLNRSTYLQYKEIKEVADNLKDVEYDNLLRMIF